MQTTVFETIAMALDTLPGVGRLLLLAFLLSCALYGVARALQRHPSQAMQLYYRKACIFALVAVPCGVGLFGVQMPVYVVEAQAFHTEIPAWISYGLFGSWLIGVIVVLGRSVRRYRQALRAHLQVVDPADEKMQRRLKHWSTRLNIKPQPELVLGGSAIPWQAGGRIVLPQAARHWPVGHLDVCLLQHLAQRKQKSWIWLVLGHVARAIYWPLPWVASLLATYKGLLVKGGLPLAEAAYHDSEGWLRDYVKLKDRYATLNEAAPALEPFILVTGLDLPVKRVPPAPLEPGSWEATKARRAERDFDPYERVYWLIAVASVVIGVGTTLTIEQASPEFERGFLDVKWKDQMGRQTREPAAPISPFRPDGDEAN
ncbi:MAG: hypothetical protein ACI9UU_001797 [Candidatus Azotimanducaceae bacterium]|jgi:hypothetical protein